MDKPMSTTHFNVHLSSRPSQGDDDLAKVKHTLPTETGSKPVALVIGAGFGGLASAIRLSKLGYDVQILEKLDAPGGRAYVHKQDGFTFDAGPTIITAPFLLEELWQLCGKKMSDSVKLVEMSPFYKIRFHNGQVFEYSGDTAAMHREIAKFNPKDIAGYDKFMQAADRCKRLGFEEMGDVAFDGYQDLIKALPSFARMQAWRTLYSLVSEHIKHPFLRVAFSFHPLLIGGNPFSVTCAYALIHSLEKTWGVHSAMGGTGAIVNGLVGLLDDLGVKIHYNCAVKRIRVENGKACGVELEDDVRLDQSSNLERIPRPKIDSDIVVCNSDSAWTYKHLIEHKHKKHWSDKRIEKGRYSMGLFVWYFGVNRQYPDIPHHMMLLTKRYKELLKDIFTHHRLAQDFSLYLHRPTATDPSLAPPGCDTFYALAPVPNLDSQTDWNDISETFRQAIQDHLESTVLPELGQHLVTSKVTTPLDFQNRLYSYKGAGFGLEPLLTQSAVFRPHNRSEDIAGLYMVGASTHPGAGVPGVLMSAKALEKVIPHAATLQKK
jgi:phytoene desaturase